MTTNSNPTPATVAVAHLGGFVPESLWGKDHRTTLLYAEVRAVDYRGKLDPRHMREDGVKYPTYLKDGVQLSQHNDWDCLDDAQHEGLILVRNRSEVELTDKGWEYIGKLRRARAERIRARALSEETAE